MSDVGRYRRVYTRLWRHPGFRALTEGERLVALYVLSGPQSNRLGYFNFSAATASEDLGILPQTLTRRLANITTTFGWLYDSKSRVVWIPSWWRFNAPENRNVIQGSLRDLTEVPASSLLESFVTNVADLSDVPDSGGKTLRGTFQECLTQRLGERSRTQDQSPFPSPLQELRDKTPSLRSGEKSKSAEKGNHTPTIVPLSDSKLQSIAREVLRDYPRASQDERVMHVQYLCRHENIDCSEEQAKTVLNAARVA